MYSIIATWQKYINAYQVIKVYQSAALNSNCILIMQNS
jgi:hypothetical protein